jgi:plasmid stabilization system protein ParE
MPQVRLTPRAGQDLKRLYDFLLAKDERVAGNAIETIKVSFKPLAHLPMIGRPIEDDIRELVIDFGRIGYLALYHYDTDIDTVIILAIRHQRENDYK